MRAGEEVIRLGFLAIGDQARANVAETETIWRDPETRTEAQHVDALVKLGTLGVPEEQLWADAGYTPTQIARFLEMRSVYGSRRCPSSRRRSSTLPRRPPARRCPPCNAATRP